MLISEATDAEYIVVDVLRDPSSPEPLIFRYYIDVNKTGGYAWHPHDLAIDLEAGKYSSCLGRRSGQYVDGLYTIGQVGGSAQFMYQPLYNVFNPNVPASPSLFRLPGGGSPMPSPRAGTPTTPRICTPRRAGPCTTWAATIRRTGPPRSRC